MRRRRRAVGGGGTSTATNTAVASTAEASAPATAVVASPTATPAVPHAVGEANTEEGRRAFARAVDGALARGDVAFVTERLRGSPDVAFAHFKQPPSSMAVSQAMRDLTRLLGPSGRADRDWYGLAAAKAWWVGHDASRPMLVVTGFVLERGTRSSGRREFDVAFDRVKESYRRPSC